MEWKRIGWSLAVGAAGVLAASSAAAQTGLRVQYRVPSVAVNDNHVRPHLRVVNSTGSAVPLSELTMRYWYTVDGVQPQVYVLDAGPMRQRGRDVRGRLPIRPGAVSTCRSASPRAWGPGAAPPAVSCRSASTDQLGELRRVNAIRTTGEAGLADWNRVRWPQRPRLGRRSATGGTTTRP